MRFRRAAGRASRLVLAVVVVAGLTQLPAPSAHGEDLALIGTLPDGNVGVKYTPTLEIANGQPPYGEYRPGGSGKCSTPAGTGIEIVGARVGLSGAPTSAGPNGWRICIEDSATPKRTINTVRDMFFFDTSTTTLQVVETDPAYGFGCCRFRATVTPGHSDPWSGAPQGDVTFYLDGIKLETTRLFNANSPHPTIAETVKDLIPAGRHVISATFDATKTDANGDQRNPFRKSEGSLAFTVRKHVTQSDLIVQTPGTPAAGTPVEIDLGYACSSSCAPFDGDTARLLVDGRVAAIQQVPPSSSGVRFVLSTLPPGTHTLVGVYDGSTNFHASRSPERTITIGGTATVAPNGMPERNLTQEAPRNPACKCGGAKEYSGGIPQTVTRCPCPDASIAQKSGDPVTLSSGEFTSSAVDLAVASRGFPWSFERNYRSGVSFMGPLGANWDFGLNGRLVEVVAANLAEIRRSLPSAKVGDVVRVGGYGRSDPYVLRPDGSYDPPPGSYTSLTRTAGGYIERDRTGSVTTYTRSAARANTPGLVPMTAIADRDGNRTRLHYDASGQLVQVDDTLGRSYAYAWNPRTGLLSSVTDFAGRKVTFAYNGRRDLVSVTGPAVTGTPTGNDFPAGLTTRYTYSSGFADPRLNHNLLSVTHPNEVRHGGPPYVQISYLGAGANLDKVASQVLGGTNATGVPAGGTITYQYSTLAPASADPNVATFETRVTDRNGNRSAIRFSTAGSILSMQELTNRNVDPQAPASYTTTSRYNAENELVSVTLPNGNSTSFTYASGNPDPFQRGNLLSTTATPDAARGGDQASITSRVTYEPIYSNVRTIVDPRGLDPSYVPQNGGTRTPARYTTTSTFDYEESCNFAAIGAKVGLPAARAQSLLQRAGMCGSPLGDVNGDGVTNQVSGHVIRSRAPNVALGTACAQDALTAAQPTCSLQARAEATSSQPIVALRTLNSFGQVTKSVDPEGNVTQFLYYPASDPDGDGALNDASANPSTGGFLRAVTADALSSPVRNTGTNPPPVLARSEVVYDALGRVLRTTDQRGVDTTVIHDQADRVNQVTHAAAARRRWSATVREPSVLTGPGYVEQLFYDANGNVVLAGVEDRGNTSAVDGNPPAAVAPPGLANPDPVGGVALAKSIARYDILDQPVETLEEVSASSYLSTKIRRDPNGNGVLAIEPAGNASSILFDERDLPFTVTRGATGPPSKALLKAGDPTAYNVRGGAPSTSTTRYDPNGNVVSSLDGNGHRNRMVYDGFDRPTSTVDSVGTQVVLQYDPGGSVVRASSFGPIGGASPASDGPATLEMPVSDRGTIVASNLVNETILSAAATRFDELGRAYLAQQSLFVSSVPTIRPPDVRAGATDLGKLNIDPSSTCAVPGVAVPPGGWKGCVSARGEFDRNSRLRFAISADGATTAMRHDGLGRTVGVTDPKGSTLRVAYDPNGNTIESLQNDAADGGSVGQSFLTTSFHDSLNRLTQVVDNIGQSTALRYDSRGNLVASADARGPVTGSIARRAFAPGLLTVNATNGFGNVRLASYDGLGRPVTQRTVMAPGGQGDGVTIGVTADGVPSAPPPRDMAQGGGDGLITTSVGYDVNSLVTSMTDDNGNRTTFAYDNLDRRVTETFGASVPPNLADRVDPLRTTRVSYDRADNVVGGTDLNGSSVSCALDNADRRTSCTVTPAAGVIGTTSQSWQYDGLGRTTLAVDRNDQALPGDDARIGLSFDSLSRPIEEREAIGSAAPTSTDTAWRAGALRSRLTYPNGRALTFRYNAANALSSVSNAGAATPLATWTYVGGRVLEKTSPQSKTTMRVERAEDIPGHDGLGRPSRIRYTKDGSFEQPAIFRSTWDRAGNRTAEVPLHQPTRHETYQYDSANRMTSFQRPGQTPLHGSFTLDGAGNWKSVDGQTRKHSSTNELFSQTTDANTTTLAYDSAGNLTDDGTNTYAWDALDRLRTVKRKSDSATIATYTYDAAGRRVTKATGGATTRYLHDGLREIETRKGASTQRSVFGLGIDELLVLEGAWAGGRLFALHNALGSVMALTDADANVKEAYRYDAYGRQTVLSPGPTQEIVWGGADVETPGGTSRVGNERMFAGMRLDAETGLYQVRARYLSPKLGRFISRDPIGIWGDGVNAGNGYGYVGGRPMSATDPLGLDDDTPSAWNRFVGGLKVIGGAVELLAGAALTGVGAAASSVGVGLPVAAAGLVVIAHGTDTVSTGFGELRYGLPNSTMTSRTLQSAGMSKGGADIADAVLGGVLTGGASAATKALGPAATAVQAARASAVVVGATEAASAGRGCGMCVSFARLASRGTDDVVSYGPPVAPAVRRLKEVRRYWDVPAGADDANVVLGTPGPGLMRGQLQGLQRLADETGVELVVMGSRQTGTRVSTGGRWSRWSDIDIGVVGGTGERALVDAANPARVIGWKVDLLGIYKCRAEAFEKYATLSEMSIGRMAGPVIIAPR